MVSAGRCHKYVKSETVHSSFLFFARISLHKMTGAGQGEGALGETSNVVLHFSGIQMGRLVTGHAYHTLLPCRRAQGPDLLKGCRHWTESLLRRDTNLLTVNIHGNGFRLLHGWIQDFGKGGGVSGYMLVLKYFTFPQTHATSCFLITEFRGHPQGGVLTPRDRRPAPVANGNV